MWIDSPVNGGFVERQDPDARGIISYDMLRELNAGNYLARRSLEDMRSTAGQSQGRHVMLQAANQGAVPSSH